MYVVITAETDPHEGKRKVEALWPIFRLHHQKSRYIYDLFYRRKAISRGNDLKLYICNNKDSFSYCTPYILAKLMRLE